MKTTQDTEVLIVGAGPAGLMLANILGMYGKRVTVLEAMDTLIDYPRGVGLDDESFRTIQTVGLVEAIRPHTNPQHIMRLVNGAGKVMLVNNPQTVEFGWERKHGFIQPEADKALYEVCPDSATSRCCSAIASRTSKKTASRSPRSRW